MSRSRRAPALALAIAGLAAGLFPITVRAHAIGEVYTLPVPGYLYYVGAGFAVAASFVVAVVLVRPPPDRPRYPALPLPGWLARAGRVGLAAVGLLGWFGTILAGYLVDPISPLPPVLLWIWIWVGLPICAVILGNPWPSLSPFRSLFGGLETAGRRIGVDRLDAGLPYPPGLRRWPAVALLFAGGWCELILPDHTTPLTVANLMIGYTLLTLIGMVLFGRVAWLANAELFEVLLGWFGRVGPLGRRVVDPEVCDGCTEGCSPDHCVDCPECAAAAIDGERRPELRPWFVGLTEVRNVRWSDGAFVVLALSIVTYDGLSETGFWAQLINPLFNLLWEALPDLAAVLAVQTIGMLGVWIAFMIAFSIAVALTRRIHDPERGELAMSPAAGMYGATLLPIAAGYMIAHYLTVVVQGVIWVPELVADPLATVPPLLDWFGAGAVWYLSVGAIVLGHIVAVVLAHRLALRHAMLRPVVAGLPLVVLMVGYTVLSLWIIATPLTVDPASQPGAALPLD